MQDTFTFEVISRGDGSRQLIFQLVNGRRVSVIPEEYSEGDVELAELKPGGGVEEPLRYLTPAEATAELRRLNALGPR